MIKKMEQRRITKTTNIKQYRRLNNQLRREPDRAKEVYMEEIWTFRRNAYMISCIKRHNNQGEELAKPCERLLIEDYQGNIVTDHRQALRIWEKYIHNLYDSKNRPKDIAIEAED